ncbi:MAG: acylphosphatase [Candidatus Caldarchaeales archaeon]|nr:acylphosphatase [Candidatus Caldarchaeales archaeon]
MRAVLVRIYGRIQRVGYRRFVLDTAQELGLTGYVKNEKDGSVTVFTQGDDAVVEKFIELLKSPPQPAHVRSVDVKDARPRPALKYFAIKPSPLHEELQEGFGAMQTIFTDYWGEFRNFVGEFRDYRQEFRDYRQEFRDFRQEFKDYREEFRDFRDESLKISKEILDEVKGVRRDLQTILDERLARMERDIAEIKAKIGLT